MKISIAKPQFNHLEEQAVLSVLKSGNLAQGESVEEFEKKFAGFIGTKHAIAVSNGTVAIYLALLALDIQKEDEIITTPFSFIASTSMILALGAKPVFVDIDETFNINAELIEKAITNKTKAILPVHLFGKSADLKKIKYIAKKYKLKLIEDACQAHGAISMKKKVGSIGDAGCFSFYSTKNMTTGEGGMITTNNRLLASKLRLLRSHGMKKRYIHKIVGFNFRMTNIQGALGIIQLSKLSKFNQKRIENANIYNKLLQNITGLLLPKIPVANEHVFHQYTIRITKEFKHSRSKVLKNLHENGIQTGIYYPVPIHKQEVLKDGIYRSYPITEKISEEVLSLPIHPGVSENDIRFISNVLVSMTVTKKTKSKK